MRHSLCIASRHPLALCLLLFAAPCAFATNDDPALALLTTSFASPGARAAGMGGAFIGVADDSSAAFLNPAGLTLLANREATLEFRARNAELQYLDTFRNFRTSGGDSSTRELAYATVNFPLPDYDLAVAAFYGTLADAEFQASNARIPLSVTSTSSVFLPTADVSITQQDRYAGIGIGWAPEALGAVRVGLSVYSASRDLTTTSNSENVDTRQRINDEDIGVNLGLHYALNDQWGFGLNYRTPLEYDLEIAATQPDPGRPGTFNTNSYLASTVIPSSWAIGVAYRPTPQWVIAVDAVGIQHAEQVSDSRRPAAVSPNAPAKPEGLAGRRGQLKADNAVDLRFGVEYLLESTPQIYLRAGYSRQQSGRIYYAGELNSDSARRGAAIFPRGSVVNFVTLGLGLSGERFGFDIALDRSSERSEFVLSSYMSF